MPRRGDKAPELDGYRENNARATPNKAERADKTLCNTYKRVATYAVIREPGNDMWMRKQMKRSRTGSYDFKKPVVEAITVLPRVSGFPEFHSGHTVSRGDAGRESHESAKLLYDSLYARQCPMVTHSDAGSIPARSTKLLTEPGCRSTLKCGVIAVSNTAGLNWFRRGRLMVGSSCRTWTLSISVYQTTKAKNIMAKVASFLKSLVPTFDLNFAPVPVAA